MRVRFQCQVLSSSFLRAEYSGEGFSSVQKVKMQNEPRSLDAQNLEGVYGLVELAREVRFIAGDLLQGGLIR